MNMQNLMAQAQRVQRELQKTNEEIENTVFTGESGAVKVEITGKHIVQKVEILDDEVLQDKELLSDMIIFFDAYGEYKNAFKNIDKMKQEKLGKYTGGLGGLF